MMCGNQDAKVKAHLGGSSFFLWPAVLLPLMIFSVTLLVQQAAQPFNASHAFDDKNLHNVIRSRHCLARSKITPAAKTKMAAERI